MRAAAAACARRPNLTAALISLALAAAMVGPALLPGRVLSSADIWWFSTPWATSAPAGLERPANPDLEDAAQQFQPLRAEVKRQLPAAPLWNPWIAGGRPLLADAQSAVLSPFMLPAYVLPLQRSLGWTALLILWAATFGMYGLARALGMRFAGALMAGVVYGLNLWLVSHLSYPHAGVWAMLPWLLWAVERLVRQPDPRSAGLLALAVGIQLLAGHPESSAHVLLAALAFFVLRALQARGRGRLRPRLLALGGGLLAGAGIAAALLVPFTELLLNSADLAERSGTGVDKHIDSTYLLGFFMYDYWGRATQTAITPFLFARSWYAGALPLMLAAVALIVHPRGTRVWIAAAGALVVATIFGVPPLLQLATRLPLLSLGHNDRLIVIALACLALLAGWGLDELCSRDAWATRRRAIAAAVVAILLLPLFLVILRGDLGELLPRAALKYALALADPPPLADPTAASVIRGGSVVLWIALAGSGAALIVLRLRGRLGGAFAGLALALVVVDLMRAGMGYNPAIPTERAAQPVTGALQYLADRPGRFAGTGDVPQNVAALRLRLEDARGYDLPILERYNRLWRQEISPEFPDLTSTFRSLFLQVPRVDERRLRGLRLLGVSHLLTGPGATGLPEAEARLPGLTTVYDGPDGRVLRVDRALPRAFVAGAQQPVDGEEAALAAVTSAGFDGRRVAVTERRLPGVPEGGGAAGGSARIVEYEPDRVAIEADLARPGVVVLGDNWYPGWTAKLDGRPVDVERVDYVLRGVAAPAGRHRVEFAYRPWSWRIGWILTVLSLAVVSAALLLGGARGRLRRGPRSQPQQAG